MFSRMQLSAAPEELSRRYSVDLYNFLNYSTGDISGFDHSRHPVIWRNDTGLAIDGFIWGLIPPHRNKTAPEIWNSTIAAKLEYINKRYAWSKVASNRCLVPATA